ncbi:MAG: preprotein translocase subunit SecY [Deltaproteobacteria bacterium]|nr:preprotein translocase subunit SecY [Deltaproteobacteria bacterium]MBI4196460.1 preprotein translocase subunit SecY [Deltaproteobacteria bacterium]
MALPVVNLARIPELRKRLLFTVLLLAVYRLGVYVPTPGVDTAQLSNIIQRGTVFEIFNLFSGGALERFSVFALGIMPYISASIILQLLTVAVPSLERLSKEGGEQGRRKITQYTRYGTVLLSLIQGFGISYGLQTQGVILPGIGGLSFYLSTMITLSAGTCFIMWLGEQISERGIGNGISLIIFAGIVTSIPGGFRDAWMTKEQFAGLFGFLLLLAFIFLVVAFIIFFERSHRRIPIQYAKRVVGRKLYGGQSTHLPLKLNSAGVIPPIFASSLILFPATMAQFVQNEKIKTVAALLGTGWLHDFLYVALIIFFTYFYTAVTFNPSDVADNIRKFGGFIPGIRPGPSTSEYIDRILARITLGGALYLAGVCVLPQILITQFGIPGSLATLFGGTSLLIVVGVSMDTLAQIEAHLLARNYEGLMGEGKGRFRGRRG